MCPSPSPRPPRFLFINENIGGHRTVHASFRKIFAGRDDIEVEFLDGREPGLIGKLLRAPVPLLSKLDLDLQPLRGQLVHSWHLRRRVQQRLAEGGIDAIHLYTQNAMLGGARLLRQVPTVITTDSTGRLNVFSIPYRTPTRFTAPLSRLNLIFERPVLKAAVKVFANTRKVVDSLQSGDYLLPPSRVAHLELGIHSPYFTTPPPVRDTGRRPTIVFLGTSLARKGGNLLLDIWREELRDKADLTLVTLEELPAEPGLQVINDLKPGEGRLWEILAAADIMCFPSTIDQAPNVILEAMAAGLPVIAHPNGAIPEMVVDGRTGYLVDCHRKEPVAAALHRLIDDPQLRTRLGDAGHERARERYNLIDSTQVIVQELIDAAQPPALPAPSPVTTPGAESIFDVHSSLSPGLRLEWEELAARRGTRFASRPSYAWTWFESLGKGELALATLHREGRLVALLPLHARTRLGVTTHRLLGHGLGTIGEALAADPAALRELVAGLWRRGVLLELTHVPEDSPLLAELSAGDDWVVDYRRDETCPVMLLPPGSTARDLRSRKTLKRLRVSRDAIAREHGPVELKVIRTPAGLDACWVEITALTGVSRVGEEADRLDMLAGEYGDFSRRFLREEAQLGNLILMTLRVNRKLVALDVQFRTGRREEAWYTRYDPAYARLAPGHQLLEFLADNHDELGVYESDQMIGTNSYKVDWQNADYAVGTVCASPRQQSWQLPVARVIRSASSGAYQQYREIQPRLVALTGKLR